MNYTYVACIWFARLANIWAYAMLLFNVIHLRFNQCDDTFFAEKNIQAGVQDVRDKENPQLFRTSYPFTNQSLSQKRLLSL